MTLFKPIELSTSKTIYDRVPSKIMILMGHCTKEHWFWDEEKNGGLLIEQNDHFFDIFSG
ncbi:hypothetical protein D3C85_942710 [compost metagenome]